MASRRDVCGSVCARSGALKLGLWNGLAGGEVKLAVEGRGEAFGRHSVAGCEEVVLDMK